MTTTGTPSNVPSTRAPAWPIVRATGQPGIPSYGISTASSTASANPPRPLPSTTPTAGNASCRARTAATAASRSARSARPGSGSTARPPHRLRRALDGARRRAHDRRDRLGRVVGDAQQLDVVGRDHPWSSSSSRIQRERVGPVARADEDDREVEDLPGLDQRQRLEQLVERAESAGEDDEALGRLHEHRLARVEVLERERDVAVRVEPLLVRQEDVEPDREAVALPAAAVRRLHHAWAAARDDRPAAAPRTAARSGARSSYTGDPSPTRAEPKIDTAGRSMRCTAWKPARNSDAISETSLASGSRRRSKSRRSRSAVARPARAHSRSCGTCAAHIPSASATAVPSAMHRDDVPEPPCVLGPRLAAAAAQDVPRASTSARRRGTRSGAG